MSIETVLRQYFARKQHLVRYIGKLIQSKNNKMNSYQPSDPSNNFLEEVYLWSSWCHLSYDVKLTYDSRNGGESPKTLFRLSRNLPTLFGLLIWILLGYSVENGSITNAQTWHGCTALTIVSNSDKVYTVTRRRGGEYSCDPRSWMRVTRKQIWWEGSHKKPVEALEHFHKNAQ